MGSTDFFSPFFTAALILKDGTPIPLWSTEASSSAAADMEKRVGVRALPYLSSISVTTNLSELPVISATLSFPYREGIAFLDSELAEWGVNELQVMFGYSKGTDIGTSPVFSGLVMEMQPSYGSEISVTLSAHGAFSMTQMERRFDFKNMTRKQILEACLKGPDTANPRPIKLDVSVLETAELQFAEIGEANGGTSSTDPRLLLHKPIEDFEPASKTDWDIIYLICNQLQCWPQVVVPSNQSTQFGKRDVQVLKLLPREAGLARPPKKVLSLYEIDAGAFPNTLPVLSLGVETKAIYLPGALKGMIARGIGSADKKPIRKFYDRTVNAKGAIGQGGSVPKDTPYLPGVEVSLRNPDGSKGNVSEHVDGAAIVALNADHPDVDAEAVAIYEKSMAEMGVTINIETLGSPDLTAGDVVSLRGAGRRLDQNYGINEITHKFDSGGYSTSFKAFTNTNNQSTDNVTSTVPETNKKLPSTTDETNTTTVNPIKDGLRGNGRTTSIYIRGTNVRSG